MNTKNFLLGIVVCLFCSCLKNKVEFDYSGIKPIIVNPNSNFPSKTSFSQPLADSSYGVRVINLYAKYSYRTAPERDVKVTFIKNDSLAIAYNNTFLSAYKLLPADSYQLSSNQVIIKAGTLQSVIPITIFPDKIKGADNYIIGFTIVDGDGIQIADNYKSIVFTLKGK